MLRKEEVRAFNDVLEMGLALSVDERRDVRDVYSFWPMELKGSLVSVGTRMKRERWLTVHRMAQEDLP